MSQNFSQWKKNIYYHSDFYFHTIEFNIFFFKFSDFGFMLGKSISYLQYENIHL